MVIQRLVKEAGRREEQLGGGALSAARRDGGLRKNRAGRRRRALPPLGRGDGTAVRLEPLLGAFIWQRFRLRYVPVCGMRGPGKGFPDRNGCVILFWQETLLGGTALCGDNAEDEWFVV